MGVPASCPPGDRRTKTRYAGNYITHLHFFLVMHAHKSNHLLFSFCPTSSKRHTTIFLAFLSFPPHKSTYLEATHAKADMKRS